jgi:hypothetical protein
MGSLKSKLFTDDTLQSVEENQKISNIENIENQNKNSFTNSRNSFNYRTQRRTESTVNSVPKSQYFRSLRANTKKQFSNMNKNINNSSSSKLFGTVANVLRSKSHSEFGRQRRSTAVRNSKQQQQQQQEVEEEKAKHTNSQTSTAFITKQLKSTSINKVTINEEEIVDDNKNKSVSKDLNDDGNSKKNEENIEVDNNNVNSTTDSNSNYYTEDDYEWDNKNQHNDDLIENLKIQIDALNKQLEAIGKEDVKLISDLSSKIENLAKMNHVIYKILKTFFWFKKKKILFFF